MAKYWKITHLTIWWKGWRVTWSIVQKSRKFDLPYICPPAPLLPFLPDPRGRNSQANYEGKIGATCTRERNLFHLAGIFRQRPPGGHPSDRPVVISQRPIHSSLLLRPSWIKLNKRLNAFQGRKNLIDFMKNSRLSMWPDACSSLVEGDEQLHPANCQTSMELCHACVA